MYEIIWRSSIDTLGRDTAVRPLFERIAALEEFEPADYDLNQKEQWRPFDLDRTVVDALTQRTQLVRIRGRNGRSVAMVAMGKHGEEPTTVLRLPEHRSIRELTDPWPTWFEELPMRMALITTPDWRERIEAAGFEWDEERLPIALACGWPEKTAPDWLVDLEFAPPLSTRRRDGTVILVLAPDAALEGPDHRKGLSELVTP